MFSAGSSDIPADAGGAGKNGGEPANADPRRSAPEGTAPRVPAVDDEPGSPERVPTGPGAPTLPTDHFSTGSTTLTP